MDDKGNSLRPAKTLRPRAGRARSVRAYCGFVGLYTERNYSARTMCAVLMNIDAPRRGVHLARGQCISIINTLGHRVPRSATREREREREKGKYAREIPSRFFLSLATMPTMPLFPACMPQFRLIEQLEGKGR